MSPRTDVCRSGTTWYNERDDESPTSETLDAFLRNSKKSGVSRPPATVETTDAMPEGVSNPEGVWSPSAWVSVASSSSSSSSSSLSSSSSSVSRVRSLQELQSGSRLYHLVQALPTGSCAQVRPTVLKSVKPGTGGIQNNLRRHHLLSGAHQRHHRTMDDCTRPTEAYPNLRGGNPTEHFGRS